ncbi:MAG: chromate transporter [Spirochaetaceae bacterium 4572_59]|nr:MAG: chromate transporter [Spirochaetaceae bacterium 4572_59]
MSLAALFFEFFKIGLFTIGGGLATLPLLQDAAMTHGWFTLEQFFQMVAVSQSTPGPIGINMATYVGFETVGLIGGIVATAGLVCPSVIIILLVAKFFFHFNEKPLVRSAFLGLRPAVTGLIATAAFNVLLVAVFPWYLYKESGLLSELFDPARLGIFVVILTSYLYFKKHPALYIVAGAILGVIFL